MVSDISRKVPESQERGADQRQLVSDTRARTMLIPNYMLAAAQTQTR